MVRAVHKFDFKILVNWTSNKWWQVGSDRGLYFWQKLFFLSLCARSLQQ